MFRIWTITYRFSGFDVMQASAILSAFLNYSITLLPALRKGQKNRWEAVLICSACRFFFRMVPLHEMQLAQRVSKFSAPKHVIEYSVVVMQLIAWIFGSDSEISSSNMVNAVVMNS